MARSAESGGGRHRSPWRIAAWSAAALILLLPLIAMQFTGEVNWAVSDFIFAGVLLFGSLGAYEVVARKTGSAAYRAGVGLGIAATFLLLWINGAVSITDSAADTLYLGAALIGVVGVILALVRPRAGAFVLLVTALALVASFVASLATGMVPNAYASAFEVLAISGFFIVMYAGAAWLLREAARTGEEPSPAKP